MWVSQVSAYAEYLTIRWKGMLLKLWQKAKHSKHPTVNMLLSHLGEPQIGISRHGPFCAHYRQLFDSFMANKLGAQFHLWTPSCYQTLLLFDELHQHKPSDFPLKAIADKSCLTGDRIGEICGQLLCFKALRSVEQVDQSVELNHHTYMDRQVVKDRYIDLHVDQQPLHYSILRG